MIFDKNEKRARTLERNDPIKYADRIRSLRLRPLFFVRYWDKEGRAHDERVPEKYQASKLEAEKYEKIVRGDTVKGSHIVPKIRKTTISDMCDFFMNHKIRKVERTGNMGGSRAAFTHCKVLQADIGQYTFDSCREDPDLLQLYVDKLPKLHPTWSSKYIWNHVKELKAVFNLWINKKLLNIPNPCNAIDEPEPGTRVLDYVPTHEDYERIIAAGLIEGVDPEALRLIGAVRYSGFRINEVLQWQVSDCVLDPDDNGLPYIWVTISKQKRRIRVPRPIRRELADLLKLQIGYKAAGPVWRWKNPPYKLLKVFDTQENGKKVFRTWLYEVAGVPIPRPFHDFRKTVKLELKRRIPNSKLAQAYQGHKTEAMDDYYTYWQREDLEIAVADSYRDQLRGQGAPQK